MYLLPRSPCQGLERAGGLQRRLPVLSSDDEAAELFGISSRELHRLPHARAQAARRLSIHGPLDPHPPSRPDRKARRQGAREERSPPPWRHASR